MNTLWNFLVYVFLSIMLVIIGLLFSEYNYFKTQAEKLIELQEEYQSYIDTFKEKIELMDLQIDEQKKKVKIPHQFNNQEFALVSKEAVFAEPLNRVNRNTTYLRQEALKYARAFHLEPALSTLYEYGKSISHSVTRTKQRKRTPAKKYVQQKKYSSEIAFRWPIEKGKFWISSSYGPRKKTDGSWGFHHGTDFAAPKRTPVYASAAGTIIETSFNPNGFGKSIVIAHTKKWRTRYAHLHAMFVKPGQKVVPGQLIGEVGDTGNVRGKNGIHLHFEVTVFGKRINPLYILS